MHQAGSLWEKGRNAKMAHLLGATDYGQSGAFWQFCQAVAECLLNDSREKQLLQDLLSKESYIQESGEAASRGEAASDASAPGPKGRAV